MTAYRLHNAVVTLALALASTPAVANAPGSDPVAPGGFTVYVSGFAGRLTSNVHHELFLTPWSADFLDSYLAGVALGVERPGPWPRFDIGAELQLVRWTGAQRHWELNAMPVVGRYRFEGQAGPLRSVAFGLGLSYASEIPSEELARDGESNRFLVYWSAEAEFGAQDGALSPFIKVHHRSNAFGLIEEESGSNSIAFGLRRRF